MQMSSPINRSELQKSPSYVTLVLVIDNCSSTDDFQTR